MGRRLSRFRRASQQVVKVTRRIFTMCYCGEVRTETEVKVVPVASVLNGSITSPKHGVSNRSCSVHSGCEHDALEGRQELAKECSHSSNLSRRRGIGIAAKPRLIIVEPLDGSKDSSQGDSERGDVSVSGSKKGTEESDSKQDEVKLYYALSEKWAQISPIEVQILGNLVRGYFGDIDMVISSDGSSGKFIRKKLTTTASYQEAATLIQCQGDYVVKLLACFTTRDATYLYMPYYCRRDLDYWLERDPDRQVFGEPQANFIVLHLLVAIYSIHKIAVLHMDIKPGNIFIDNSGYPVLADFGGALRTDQALRAHCFTPDYSSPEVRMRLLADKMADLWSAACTYYDIVTNKVPTLDLEMEDEEVIACRNVGFDTSSYFSPLAAEFISSQFELDKTKRLGFHEGVIEVMRHPVFQGHDWDTVKDRAAGKPSPLCEIFPVLMGQTRGSCEKKCKGTFVKWKSTFTLAGGGADDK